MTPITPATLDPSDHRPAPSAGRSPLADLAGLLRVGQWPKNLLVMAAPFAAGSVTGSAPSAASGLGLLMLAMAAWCLASSATYIVNDYRDREQDRHHPVKCTRPLAAGTINPVTALGLSLVLAALALVLGWRVAPQLSGLLAVYMALVTAYSIELKKVAVLDLLVVAAGFPIRAVSGAFAIDVPVTPWFVFVISSAALLVVSAKRLSELRRLGPEADNHREVLSLYSERFLTQVHTLAIAFFLGVYAIWAVSVSAGTASRPTLTQFSIAPAALVILRFSLLVDRGLVDRPEELLYRDRVSQLGALGWAATFYAGVVGW